MNLLLGLLLLASRPLDPELPAVMAEHVVAQWKFDRAEDAWPVMNQCAATVTQGVLRITATGNDPYLRISVPRIKGPLVVRWRMRTTAQCPSEFFWATTDRPNLSTEQSQRVVTANDGQWHEYVVTLPPTGVVTVLRFDPSTSTGTVEVADARVTQSVLHPLQFERADTIRNTATNAIAFTICGGACTAQPSQAVTFPLPPLTNRPFEKLTLAAQPDGLPPVTHTIYRHNPQAETDWQEYRGRNTLVRVAKDRSGARLFWKNQLVAIAAPLPEKMTTRLDGDDILFTVRARETVTGPCIRALGTLEQGLLAGVEHLGKGEASSSTLDVERSEHIRYEPDPMLLTMPLAAYVTDRGSVAMLWDDMNLQPVFSTPNRYDSTDDHLMAVKGTNMQLRVRLGDKDRLEDAILWAVRRRGLPELPRAPRSPRQQRELCLAALNGPLLTTNGWLHATWDNRTGQYFCDQASTIYRLTGEMPPVPALVPHGAHIANWTAYFVTGRAGEWLRIIKGRDEAIMRRQQPDGSFRYDGKYRRGHFEDTASGWCAQHAVQLLEDARYTGDERVLAAGLKTLEYMKRFSTPRGAQVWEMPLHTPDLVAAAHLVRSYVLGYELTGRREYLDLARRWALSGIPFVYQWGRYPIQKYATIGVLGATDWTGVVWIGLPVQWCGTSYAYALTQLAEHDDTINWRRVAEGILVAAEQMQYADGPHIGCLPDSFSLPGQHRNPADVNPCVLVAIRQRLDGELDSLAVAADGKHRIVAPFPVRLRGDKAIVNAHRGVAYEVLVDGSRIVKIESRGTDVINLANTGTD